MNESVCIACLGWTGSFPRTTAVISIPRLRLGGVSREFGCFLFDPLLDGGCPLLRVSRVLSPESSISILRAPYTSLLLRMASAKEVDRELDNAEVQVNVSVSFGLSGATEWLTEARGVQGAQGGRAGRAGWWWPGVYCETL